MKDMALALAVLITTVGAVSVAILIARGVVRRWLTPRGAADGDMVQLREAVERMSGELADVHQTVAELQERVDFAERLLAKQKQQTALPER
jgi:hypothetical protein